MKTRLGECFDRFRFAHAACWALLSLALMATRADAQSATIFEENFTTGLGQFTSSGSISTTGGLVRMRGSLVSDGAITSAAISTVGYTDIVLSFSRVTSGLDTGEAGVASVSVNGGAFTTIESTRSTTNARVSFPLGAAAANQARVVVRFAVNASSLLENYEVDAVVVSGTRSGGPGGPGGPRPAIGEFVTFESGHVRPLALSADGQRLYAVNTPDNRVEVFDTSGAAPTLIESIPVGLEPVALALANEAQLWVVNHLSDSVSIIDVSSSPAHIVNTLYVGDEPREGQHRAA